MQYLIAFCSQPAAASDVMSGRFVRPIVPDKCVKFSDHCFNHSPKIPPKLEAALSRVVASDVKSGEAVK